MKIIGIIAEYNPFHNGHIYHINKIKELYKDSIIILVLNGYFLERGEVSIISKRDKVNIALLNNIDIVLELPFVYGTQSADIFANASITYLEDLGCDYVVFGSESNNLEKLTEIAQYSVSENELYKEKIKELLNTGLNYPTALAKALNIDFDFLPNDLLGISYIKSILSNNYNIKPITIKRTNDYHDTTSKNEIVSASNIRYKLKNNENIENYIPKIVSKYIHNIDLNDFFKNIKYKIITEHDLSIYLDVDEGIENRLKKVINECSTTDELIEKVKSKRYTYNKIRRMLVHILVGFTKEDNKNLKHEYIKILGFNEIGKKYLNKRKKETNTSFIVNKDSLVYKYELTAGALYDLVTNSNSLEYETKNKPIK